MTEKQKLKIFMSGLLGNYLSVSDTLKENKEDHLEFIDDACEELLDLLEIGGQSHQQRHKLLHRNLDELVADFINQTHKLPSQTSVMELMKWSYSQTLNPTEAPKEGTPSQPDK